jgi:hypothetical protein
METLCSTLVDFYLPWLVSVLSHTTNLQLPQLLAQACPLRSTGTVLVAVGSLLTRTHSCSLTGTGPAISVQEQQSGMKSTMLFRYEESSSLLDSKSKTRSSKVVLALGAMSS